MCSLQSILLYDTVLMEMFDCIYCELALNFDVILAHQQVCKYLQKFSVKNVYIKDFPPIKSVCSLL